jgi:small-conductance mechanosensitive channel
LCRLRHQGTVYPNNTTDNITPTSIATTHQIKQEQEATSHIKQEITNIKQPTKQRKQQQLAIETNTPQISSSSSTTSSLSSSSSSSSSYMAKDLISSTKSSLKDQEQSSNNLLTQSAATMIAAAAAAFGYPTAVTTAATTRLPILQSPFSNINAAALAAYSSYLTNNDLSQSFNSYTSIEADLIKQITFEARKLCDTMNSIEALPLTNIKPEISSQIMDLINNGLSNDRQTREDTIRKLASFILQRPVDKLNYYENCLNEAIIQLCVLKPILLTRRDDLTNYGKQILDNLGIVENGKR